MHMMQADYPAPTLQSSPMTMIPRSPRSSAKKTMIQNTNTPSSANSTIMIRSPQPSRKTMIQTISTPISISCSNNSTIMIRSPQSYSPRSSKKMARNNKILSILGVLVVFSVFTNLFFWREGRDQAAARHYGMEGGGIVDNMRRDAAWSPLRHEDEMRIVFRDGKMKRRWRGSNTTKTRGNASKEGVRQRYDSETDLRLKKKGTIASSDRMLLEGSRERKKSSLKLDKIKESHDKQQHGAGQRKQQSSKNGTSTSNRIHPENEQVSPANSKRKGDGQRKNHPQGKNRKDEVLHEKRTKANNQHQMMKPQRRLFQPHPNRKKKQSSPWRLSLPAPTEESIKLLSNQLLVILDGNQDIFNENRTVKLKYWLVAKHEDRAIDNASEDEELAKRSQTVVWDNDEDCVPMAEWQRTVHPTCNSLHEMDISLLLSDDAFSLVSSKGHWRNAWKVDVSIAEVTNERNVTRTKLSNKHDDNASLNKLAVLKSLKYIHDPNEEVFELSRVDAISLDVLTRSRFTINIYGFCGSSSIQEFAGGDLKGLLPTLDPIEKLRMASWVASGVADIHAVDSLDSFDDELIYNNNDTITSSGEGNGTSIPIPLIHNDINMDNVLLGYRNGVETPILNDFNIAVFRKKHALTGEPCRFHGRFANPQWMSPEQQERPEDELSTGYLNEKIDIYALGNILYKIAVGNSPWKYEYKAIKITPQIKGKISRAKLRGAKPKVPLEVRNSTNPSIKAVLMAMDRCYRNDAEMRPSAREIALYLKTELDAVELPIKVMDRFDFD